MKITFISDTHSKHNHITEDLIGGDMIIHSGDLSSMGYEHEIKYFLKWFNRLDYEYKVFIAGNHDYYFQKNYIKSIELINKYENIYYLQDNFVNIDDIKIYGSPWQPEFCDWAFNLERNGYLLREKWHLIPDDVDILITHGPPYGYLDTIVGEYTNLGCELLSERLSIIRPKIHVFGHIHTGYGYKFNGYTHFINASILNEEYIYTNKILNIDWDPKTNELIFID